MLCVLSALEQVGWWNPSFGQKLAPSNNLKEPCSLHFQSKMGMVGLLSPEGEGFTLRGVLFAFEALILGSLEGFGQQHRGEQPLEQAFVVLAGCRKSIV